MHSLTPRRNDPCPCGSGRKYKHCCQARGSSPDISSDEALRATAARAPTWEVEAVPILIGVEDPNAPRPVALLVTAGDFVVHHDFVGRLSGEIRHVAAALDRLVAAAARRVGFYPECVEVRDPELARALGALLEPRQVSVRAVESIPGLEAAARGVMERLAGEATWPPVCLVGTWGAWDLPRPLIAQLFVAAAEFWRRAPWSSLANLQAPRAELPSGREWTAGVLGNGGEEFGLALYSNPADLFEVVATAAPGANFEGIRGRLVGLTFESLSKMPTEARTEARLARLEIAGPRAYPVLMTVNTLAGGVSLGDANDLISLLRAVPAFAEAHGEAFLTEDRTGIPCEPIEWSHADSGVRLRYAGEGIVHDPASAIDRYGLRNDIHAAIREAEAEVGTDADSSSLLAAVERRLSARTADYNATPQAELGGLAPEQVARLLGGSWNEPSSAIRLRRDLTQEDLASSDVFHNVCTLLRFLEKSGGVGATQAGNLQVAAVAELLHRLREDEEVKSFLIGRGKRITEHDVWSLHHARVLAELAGLLQRRKSRFTVTRAGRGLLDPSRAGETYASLFETCFQGLDLSYGTFVEWPELQQQVAFTLSRLAHVATRWRSADELPRECVLPFALERAPGYERGSYAAGALEGHVLDRLVGFGLLERREARDQRSRGQSTLYRTTPLFGRFLSFDL